MDLKRRLIKLEWNSFETYPQQGADFYIHCQSSDKPIHKFVKIKKFNAISFNPTTIVENCSKNIKWKFSWLPTDTVDMELCKQ